jgi:hypothetical protein
MDDIQRLWHANHVGWENIELMFTRGTKVKHPNLGFDLPGF